MLHPQKYLLVLISLRGPVNPRAMVWQKGTGKLKKKFKDLIETQTCNFLACSIAPLHYCTHLPHFY
jgi:hypothetical protein